MVRRRRGVGGRFRTFSVLLMRSDRPRLARDDSDYAVTQPARGACNTAGEVGVRQR